MAETNKFIPPNPDREPTIKFNRADEVEIQLTRFNSALFTYLGNLAVFNHIYFEGDNNLDGFYIFKEFTPAKSFMPVAISMQELNFPHFRNQSLVSPADEVAFDREVKKAQGDIDDILQDLAS